MTTEAVVAAVTEEIAAVTEERIASVVEASQDRIAEAEAAAQRISDAALQTELGRRVDGVATEIGACREQLGRMEAQMSGMQAQVSEALTRPAVPSLTLEQSTAPPPPPTPPLLNPENVALGAHENPAPVGAQPNKPRRRVL